MIRVKMPRQEKKKAFKKIFKRHIKPKILALDEMSKCDATVTLDSIHCIMNEAGNCFCRAFICGKILGSKNRRQLLTPEDIAKNPKILLDDSIPLVGFQLGSAGWMNEEKGQVWYEFG